MNENIINIFIHFNLNTENVDLFYNFSKNVYIRAATGVKFSIFKSKMFQRKHFKSSQTKLVNC